MFSLIICSVRPEMARSLEENIRATIGAECEVLCCDNRDTGKGICQVYNEAARRARYDYLGFLHEDVAFHTSDWGPLLARKLAEVDCGLIGFAGSTVKPRQLTGWYTGRKERRQHFLQRRGMRTLKKDQNPGGGSFSPVVTLDGMALFMRRSLWQEYPFDEELLKGFHGYDLDLSMTLFAAGYVNYVCNRLWMEHFSLGSFSQGWLEEMRRLHAKWEGVLPLSVEPLTSMQWRRLEDRVEAEMMRVMMKMGRFEACSFADVARYWCRHPLSLRAWRLWFTRLRCLLKYR